MSEPPRKLSETELERLADLVGEAVRPVLADRSSSWLPIPVRPEPPGRDGLLPPWSGAGQLLPDVAPTRVPAQSAHRPDAAGLTAAVRAAAAGKGKAPGMPVAGRAASARRSKARLPVEVPIGVSRRHLHLSAEHTSRLFGSHGLTPERDIKQPGQFVAQERLTVVGPRGQLEGVRIVGPERGETQLELAPSDARVLGVEPPLLPSGVLQTSSGGVTLLGPEGKVDLVRGVIVAVRHLHCSPIDAERWGLSDGDLVAVRCGAGSRSVTFHEVLVRSGPAHATELHLDQDEAFAAGVRTGDSAWVVAVERKEAARRPLLTERDVLELARSGKKLLAGALLTPSARDRARALGLLR